MDTALDLPTVTVMPLPEAVKLAVIFGIVLGFAFALFEIFTAVFQKKLTFTSADSWFRQLAVQLCAFLLVMLLDFLALQWFFPPKILRMLFLDQALESLGYFPFFLISFVVVLPFSSVGRRMHNWILMQ